MSTRAEEIAGEGPYKAEVVDPTGWWTVTGPGVSGMPVMSKDAAMKFAERMNTAYKQGQQDRWIPLSEKGPAERETVWACDPVTKFVALACRVWIEDGDQGGWLWAVSNGTIYSENDRIVSECEMDDDYNFTQWQSLPALPSPPNLPNSDEHTYR